MSPAIPPPALSDSRALTVLGVRCEPEGRNVWRGTAPGLRITIGMSASRWVLTAVWTLFDAIEGNHSFIAHTIDVDGASLAAVEARLRDLMQVHLPQEPRS